MSKKLMMNNYSDFDFNNENYFMIKEDFEDDVFNFNIHGDWSRYETTELSGNYVYKSKPINHNESTSFSFTTAPKNFSKCFLWCAYNVSSEESYDSLKILVNEVEKRKLWAEGYCLIELSASQLNNIEFIYSKDGNNTAGRDNVYIGEIRLIYYNDNTEFIPIKTMNNLNHSNIILSNNNWFIKDGYLQSEAISDRGITQTRIFLIDNQNKNTFVKITYDISSEPGWDKFTLNMYDSSNNLTILSTDSGIKTEQTILLPIEGIDNLLFRYSKDGSNSHGEDCVKITKIELGYIK